MQPFARFFRIEAASAVILLCCTAFALALANSPWADAYHAVWATPLGMSIGDLELHQSLGHWITDGLMTIFFFIVGLEIKRELVAGELRDPRKAALPVLAAAGGMIAPAGIYLALQWGQPGQAGWGIPVATDIAFVVAVLALLGPRVPVGLKVMVLALAIADDIGAVLILGLFFTAEINFAALGLGVVGFGVAYVFNRIGVRRVPMYVLLGACIWLAFLKSGVHPTVAGVMLGLLTPASAWVGERAFLEVASEAVDRFRRGAGAISMQQRQKSIGQLATTAFESVSPLERLQYALHPWVAFVIVPLFALANVGVGIDPAGLTSSIAAAVICGLVLGKPLGVLLFSMIAVRTGLAAMPAGVNWRIMLGMGCLTGIGFTMSLLIASLALEGEALEAGKIGTLIGSAVSAVLAFGLLRWALPGTAAIETGDEEP